MIDSLRIPVQRTPSCSAQDFSILSPIEKLTDEELMSEFRHAHLTQQADLFVGEIFQRYQSRMTHWCLQFTKGSNQAVDLAQDVFLKAFEHLHTFRGESKVSTWLYAIARNHCLAFQRKQRLGAIDMTEDISSTLRDANAMKPFNMVEDEQINALMRRAMSTVLEPVEAKVMTLHYVQGLSLRAITQMLDLRNPSGAKAYVLKARRKLAWALRTRRSRRAAKPISCRKRKVRGAPAF
jgi:RNA polymerase sigma factor (sigma-70 family)